MIILPVPPSANKLHYAVKGRPRTPAYKAWLEESGLLLGPNRDTAEDAPYSIHIVANINRRRDLDNLIKPTLDLLVGCKVVPDDRWCDQVHANRAGPDTDLKKDEMFVAWGESK